MPLPHKIADLIPKLGLIPHPEGGFFVETHRSGSIPMSSKGQTNLAVPNGDLVIEANSSSPVITTEDTTTTTTITIKKRRTSDRRGANRPDGEERRNALTSIYWVPTVQDPRLMLGTNCSDHVHYYQGGLSFVYYLLDPAVAPPRLERVVLGPHLDRGEKLQVCVRGGMWKCGEILLPDGYAEGKDEKEGQQQEYDYTIIGEAVGPGFDFHDFTWITEAKIHEVGPGSASSMPSMVASVEHTKSFLLTFVLKAAAKIEREGNFVDTASEFYEEGQQQENRTKARS